MLQRQPKMLPWAQSLGIDAVADSGTFKSSGKLTAGVMFREPPEQRTRLAYFYQQCGAVKSMKTPEAALNKHLPDVVYKRTDQAKVALLDFVAEKCEYKLAPSFLPKQLKEAYFQVHPELKAGADAAAAAAAAPPPEPVFFAQDEFERFVKNPLIKQQAARHQQAPAQATPSTQPDVSPTSPTTSSSSIPSPTACTTLATSLLDTRSSKRARRLAIVPPPRQA